MINLQFEIFRSQGFADAGMPESTFARAAQFAAALGRDRVLSVTHVMDERYNIVTVWYWGDKVEPRE
jgi:hypothetical protein